MGWNSEQTAVKFPLSGSRLASMTDCDLELYIGQRSVFSKVACGHCFFLSHQQKETRTLSLVKFLTFSKIFIVRVFEIILVRVTVAVKKHLHQKQPGEESVHSGDIAPFKVPWGKPRRELKLGTDLEAGAAAQPREGRCPPACSL